MADVNVLDLELRVGSARGSAGTRPDPAGPVWTVKSVDRAGNVLEEHPRANPKTITKTINSEDELTLEAPKYDPATLALQPLSEVQVYRRSSLKAWAVVTGDQGSSGDGSIGFSARGLYWYFRRLFFGTANRRNMLRNGDFELGAATGTANETIPAWTRVGGFDSRHYTAATKPGGHSLPDPLEGTKAVAVSNGGEGENAYLRARFSYRTDFPPGQRVTFAAWVYVAEWTGPAAFGLGLYVSRVVGGVETRSSFASLDDDTNRGEWVRLETSLIVPPHQDGYLEVRLYSPAGWVTWDASLAVLMESTGTSSGRDQTALAATIVTYGQTGKGKHDLSIGTNCPPTGVIRKRSWQHADHDWLNDAIDELSSFPDGFDHSIELTPKTRTFTTHYPMKGTDRSETVLLKLGRTTTGGNLGSYSRSRDGAAVATSVVVRGRGDGPDREEGGAADTSEVDGLVLDYYEEAPPDLLIGELDSYAAEVLSGTKDPVEVLEVRTHAGAEALIELLETGDLVSVLIDDGFVQVDGVYRIVRIVIDCPTDTLGLTLNRWEA